jgi:hypothetical protein
VYFVVNHPLLGGPVLDGSIPTQDVPGVFSRQDQPQRMKESTNHQPRSVDPLIRWPPTTAGRHPRPTTRLRHPAPAAPGHQVVVHARETADTRGEALGERLPAVVDPLLAVFNSIAARGRLVAIGGRKKGKNIFWQEYWGERRMALGRYRVLLDL